jgi:hypothetical protein
MIRVDIMISSKIKYIRFLRETFLKIRWLGIKFFLENRRKMSRSITGQGNCPLIIYIAVIIWWNFEQRKITLVRKATLKTSQLYTNTQIKVKQNNLFLEKKVRHSSANQRQGQPSWIPVSNRFRPHEEQLW